MADPARKDQGSSISAGGDITGVAIGDNNRIAVVTKKASLPKAEDVDIQKTLIELQAILAHLNNPLVTGVAQELEAESKKAQPDKSKIAKALEMGLSYANGLAGFGDAVEKLRPHVEAVAGWLGKNGAKLLPLVGLTM